jgi:AraC-like DNA-binding protein
MWHVQCCRRTGVTLEVNLIPMSYVARWLALLDTRGVRVDEALAGTRVTLEQLEDPNARVSMPDLIEVMTRGAALAEDPSLGLELGLALKPTAHSWFGIAVMTASTLGEATDLGARYFSLLSPWRIHMLREGARAVMQFDESYDLGPARMLCLECMLGGVVRMGEFLLGHSFAHPEIEFFADFPEAPHHARFHDRMPRVYYNAKRLQARFPAAWLDRPLAFAEPFAYREAVAALDHERRLVGDNDDWLERTRALLAEPERGFPDLDGAAAIFGISSRSLRRHLQARGATFHQLRDDARRARAITLLERSAISHDAIARELGYSDAAGFARAFQRWTGGPPSAYRRQHAERHGRTSATTAASSSADIALTTSVARP